MLYYITKFEETTSLSVLSVHDCKNKTAPNYERPIHVCKIYSFERQLLAPNKLDYGRYADSAETAFLVNHNRSQYNGSENITSTY